MILNRMKLGYGSIEEIINAPNQFSVVENNSIENAPILDSIKIYILEEYNNPYDTRVLYFRTNHFHDFGTPLYQHGDHYFSTN